MTEKSPAEYARGEVQEKSLFPVERTRPFDVRQKECLNYDGHEIIEKGAVLLYCTSPELASKYKCPSAQITAAIE